MEILFTRIFKVDRENNSTSQESFANAENVNNYILNLLQKLSTEDGQRQYKFDDSSTTVKTHITNFYSLNLENEDNLVAKSITDSCEFLANRLLVKEIDAQEKFEKLGINIQKGMLIFTYLKMTDVDYKVVISKSDYDQFIEEVTGDLKEGLPNKKKIFKSFIVNISEAEGNLSIQKLVTYDSNNKVSEYWWKGFLELIPLTSDEQNTSDAFDEIDTKFLKLIKSRSKADYLQLWNMTLGYFRSDGDFDFNHYKNEIIRNYNPISDELTKDFISQRMDKITETKKFDDIFTKKPTVLRKRMKNILPLTNEIDLLIKHDIPQIDSTIVPREENGQKYIMIKSDAGYEFAKKRVMQNE